ncbi:MULTISPECIES: DMT family transporter [Providencia]|jgi:drug/metabolite transporter (DMT)-like permease|uniref:DMT family transporter n=1 Tax=Providencia TaxID=586 RepID=UPI00235FF373|nr:EamA family transporter [Providencia rettgeri]MDR2226892.1 DMT family transporter [Providencia sp.]
MQNTVTITKKRPLNMIVIQMVFVSVIWGGTFIAGRVIQSEIPPLLSATLRFLFASFSLILVLFLGRIGWKRISMKQFCQIMVLGGSGVFIYQILFFYGLQIIPASRAALLVAINPAMIALISFILWKEKISIKKGIGISLCVIGAVILLSDKVPNTGNIMINKGDLAILGCVISWGIYTVAGKKVIQEIGALHTVTYAVLFGTVLLILTSICTQEINFGKLSLLSVGDLVSLSYLGILGSAIAYVWYYQGVSQLGAAGAGSFIALNPLSAVILGTIFLNEKMSSMIILGGVLIILGIMLTNKKKTQQNSA